MADAYEALRGAGAAVWLARDVLVASGPEAASFLQGQLSQDLDALADGGSAWSWILAPTGKVDALVRVTRLAPDRWLLDTDAGWGEAVLTRLQRFKLRTKVDLAPHPARVLGVRGDASAAVAGAAGLVGSGTGGDGGPGLPAGAATARSPGVEAVVDGSWPGLPGVDLIGPDPAVPAGLVVASAEEYEAARIEAGIPRLGAELTERTIPAETGLVARTVSFTKGCYTGQELVARIDSRGSHVARSLVGIRAAEPVRAGVALVADGKEVGALTSVAESPALGWVGLAYVGRAVQPPAVLQAGPGGPEVSVQVLPLRP